MRQWTATLIALSLAVVAGRAAAQEGIQLSWADCGASGTSVQAFACNSNSGSVFRIYGSARLNSGLTPLTHIASTLDVSVDAATLPPWWQVRNAGTCRETAVGASVHAPGAMASCADWENNTTFDAFVVQEGYGGPSHARWDVVQFGNSNDPVSFPAGTENFLFTIAISRQKTVGTGSCIGCPNPACITLRQVEFAYGAFPPDPFETRVVTTPLATAGITWQSTTPSCLGAVPSPRRAWGQVKAIYR